MRAIAAVVALLPLATSCASTVEGTRQEVLINTNPSGANCRLLREGMPVGDVPETPGVVTVQTSRQDLAIRCEKEGFHTATYFNRAVVEGAGSGNVLLGGGVGGGGIGLSIFRGLGADGEYKYTSPVNITLVPLSEP